MNADAIDSILAKLAGTLRGEEQAVVDLIQSASASGGSITQHQIAKSEPWIGCHPRHEAHLAPEHETTLRRVRSIIRTLRLAHGVPIISSRDGYRFPGGKDEAQTYLKRMEREAKARAWSSLETYRGMSKLLGLKSEYFEDVEKLHRQMELFGKGSPVNKGENGAKKSST